MSDEPASADSPHDGLGLIPVYVTGCFLKDFTTTVARPQAEDPPASDG